MDTLREIRLKKRKTRLTNMRSADLAVPGERMETN